MNSRVNTVMSSSQVLTTEENLVKKPMAKPRRRVSILPEGLRKREEFLKSESTVLSSAYTKSKEGKANRCEGLSNFDAFGVPIHLYYNRQSAYRTKVGALITLILYLFFLNVTKIAFSRIIYKENPTISQWY